MKYVYTNQIFWKEKNTMYDYLVVGAGLYGAVFAHEARKHGKSVLVIDKRPNIAGNVIRRISRRPMYINMAHIFSIPITARSGSM